jgi:hypothetical protein
MSFLGSLFEVPKVETAPTWPIDTKLLSFGSDPWSIRDSFSGLAIFGQTGSGKTSASGRLVAHKFLKAGYGGLVCCSKKTEAGIWRKYLKETGREKDGRFFSVDGELRFNFIQEEAEISDLDFVENLVHLLVDIAGVKKSGEGTTNANYWILERQKLCRNAISLLLLANQPIELRSIYNLIDSAPRTAEEFKDRSWREKSYLFQLLTEAHKINGDHDEFGLVETYFRAERVGVHSGTAGTVISEFTGSFDGLRRGKQGQLFGTTTNIRPEDILEKGLVIVVDIPVEVWKQSGQLANVIWTQMFQRAVDRRDYIPGESRPVFLWQDEAHRMTLESDADFASGARSKGLASVKLCQGLPAWLDAFGSGGKHKVDALLAAHTTKFFHRNDCGVTNEFASKLIAKETVYKASVSKTGQSPISTSVSQIEEDSCPPKSFLGLKTGGPENRFVSEAIIFQSGRLWQKNKRWIVGNFSQK